MKFGEDFELGEILLILIAIGVGGYFIYQFFQNLNNCTNGSCDPATGTSNGIANSLNDYIFGPAGNPGGGESAGSSETYTGAVSQTISHPWDTLVTIFGGEPTAQ